MNRTVVFQTACYNKVPEVKWHFDHYGIQLLHEKNKLLTIAQIISKYSDRSLISVIREKSSLVKPGTNEWIKFEHFADTEHLSELRIYEIKNYIVVNVMDYQYRTNGYIDLLTDTIPAKFGWDNIFYLRSCHKSYVELAKNNVKISSRDAVVTKYIKDRIYYKNKIDLAHNPQCYNRSVEFQTEGIRNILNDLLVSYPKMIDSGFLNIFNYVYRNGIYFISPINRRIKLNWCPGINGIPFTRKEKDPLHEITYMIHDFGHFAFRPDLIFTGVHSKINYKLYMITRMMSEAITIILADMIFVHAVMESNGKYETVNERKIYPLFEILNPKLNFSDKLYLLLEANVYYCLLGDDTYYKKILGDENNIALDEYKNKYSQFFIQDYRWTENNYNKMLEQSDQYKEWYRSVQQLNMKYDLKLVSVDMFKQKLNLKDADYDNAELIKLVFNYVFNNNVKHFFENTPECTTVDENNLTKAFVRYMCNQIFIFEKLKDNPESNTCKNKIMNFLMADSINEIQPHDIVNIRSFYKHYLESCIERNLITTDDFETYNELYSIIDPFIVDYDTKYPEPLNVVSKKILDKY